jgi:hypothetical protein
MGDGSDCIGATAIETVDDDGPVLCFPTVLLPPPADQKDPTMTMAHPTTTHGKSHAPPKVRRVRVYPRLSLPIRKRLTEYCARKGVTERDIIEEAILQYLDGSSDSAKVLGRLERMDMALDAERQRRDAQQLEAHRDLELLSEAFGTFLRLWFATQQPPKPEARQMGESGYAAFALRLAEQFLRGHRFIHDLPKVEDATKQHNHQKL